MRRLQTHLNQGSAIKGFRGFLGYLGFGLGFRIHCQNMGFEIQFQNLGFGIYFQNLGLGIWFFVQILENPGNHYFLYDCFFSNPF